MAKRLGKALVKGASTGALDVRNIVVPVDFSGNAEAATRCAGSLARKFGAKLHLLHVVEPASFMNDLKNVPFTLSDKQLAATARTDLEALSTRFIDPSVQTAWTVTHGKAYQEIVAVAKQLKADMIVISTHGYTGLKHTIMGSTAERVVRHAPCAVLVLRAQAEE
jgi:nucleotide-binding universal stress UspA family protein